ncbi:hypothetical protein J2Z37_002755 [Ammoniphilus resinae]|uniref:Uncharacterized protein n=1 Tax=Ammoniphilus resinae TaxID=861532 RepID=A0ABS4GR50_9BACL|nr:hypothetical protein [Ammoniphilus resinae]
MQEVNMLEKLAPEKAVPLLLDLLRDPSSYILV